MVIERTVELDDGRVVQVHDSGPVSSVMTVLWHHGSPQTGALLPPLLAAAQQRSIRVVSYGRPSYGGSTPHPGRDVAAAADDVRQLMNTLDVDRFSTMGASGGGPHALACAALLPDRVDGVVCLAGIAPYTDLFDWISGMSAPQGLQAAVKGRAARAAFAETEEFVEEQFIPADFAALASEWRSLGEDAGRAGADGPDGLIDDDVALVRPWGFGLADVSAPVLVVQGGADRVVPPAHAQWLLQHCPSAQLWLLPQAGHVSVLEAVGVAMDWLRQL